MTAQKALFVGIENAHERHFRKIESFAQEIHADEHIEDAFAQITQEFEAFERFNVTVQIARAQAFAIKVSRKVFA